MMRRILFVDDERNLLSGLRRLLRPRRDVWDMSFALGAESALQEMESQTPDVVVSDMKMPGMDGAQLLAEVRHRYPGAARMILSGHSERLSKISVIGPTQSFLDKPCDEDTLVSAIERILVLTDLLADEFLADQLNGARGIPSAPTLYEEMLAVASDPLSHVTDVLSVIEKDPRAKAEVLRLSHSVICAPSPPANTIAQAAASLGLEKVQGLALAEAVFRPTETDPDGLDGRALHRRGLLVARVAICLARAEGWPPSAVTDAFFAGLLSDVGLPWLARSNPRGWARLRNTESVGLVESASAEEDAFGVTTARMTAFVLGRWGLPEPIVSTISALPTAWGTSASEDSAALLAVVRHFVLRPGVPLTEAGLTGVSPDRLRRWDAACSDMMALDVDEVHG
jgi:HD-like signal output (HDOD) protein/CheY-like chemotaxis protein